MHKDNFQQEIKVGDFIFGATENTGTGTLYKVTKIFEQGIKGRHTYYHSPDRVFTSGVMRSTHGFVIVPRESVPEHMRYALEGE